MRTLAERRQDPLACPKSICHCFDFPHVSTKDGPNEFGMSMTVSRVLFADLNNLRTQAISL
jgi:hypothetical protein